VQTVSDNRPDIWRLQAQLDIQGLVDALQDPSPDIRKRAAAALRAMDAEQAIAPLRHALAHEVDDDVRTSILLALEALGDAASSLQSDHIPSDQHNQVRDLLEQLNSNNPSDIIEAAEYLGELGDKIAVEPLVMRFRDARLSIQVRLAIAEALLKLESAPVEVTLLATLRNSDWHIRRNGAAILGQLRAEWAIQPLFKALSDPHPVVRRTARAALKHIGTPEARKALAWHAQQVEQQSHQPSPNPRPSKRRSMLDRFNDDAPQDRQQTSDDDTQPTSGARPAPPLNRNVLPNMQRHRKQKEQAPRPRSIQDERKRRTGEIEGLSDTARLRHSKATAPLDPDVFDQAQQRQQDNQQGDNNDTHPPQDG
jgi:hypothetical protein